MVPPNITTINGNGKTIFADDKVGGAPQFDGGVVMNETAGQTMRIENLTIDGPADGFQKCGLSGAGNQLYGIWFNDASGSVSNVIVDHVFQQQDLTFPSCGTGRGIRADAVTTAQTVTITNSHAMDYQKSGFEARDRGAHMTMDVSNSVAGPPHDLRGCIAQNAVEYFGASGTRVTGTVAHNTIIGSGDEMPGICHGDGPGHGGLTDGTAVLIDGATGVTVDHNMITGFGTDIGVEVTAADPPSGPSTGIVISFNEIGRVTPDIPDPTGHGVDVTATVHPRLASETFAAPVQLTAATDPPPNATLICNTFTDWRFNVVGALQIACTPLPDGCVAKPYSAHTPAVQGFRQATPPSDPTPTSLTWSTSAGALSPGLTLAANGAITGTPTTLGTSQFRVQVDDPSDPNLFATQAESIAIADCSEEAGENPAIPESSEPGEAVAPADVTGTLPRTGASGTLPLVGLALLGAGTLFMGVARRERGRRRKAS
jgi:hypothetical protein